MSSINLCDEPCPRTNRYCEFYYFQCDEIGSIIQAWCGFAAGGLNGGDCAHLKTTQEDEEK